MTRRSEGIVEFVDQDARCRSGLDDPGFLVDKFFLEAA